MDTRAAEGPFALIQFRGGSVHGGLTTIPVEITREDERGRVYVRHPDGKGPQFYNRREIGILRRAHSLEDLRQPAVPA
mgnify:CR=1 FL=1